MTRVIVTRAGVAIAAVLAVVELEMAVVTDVDVVMLVTEGGMLIAGPGAVLTVVIS